MAVNQAHKDRVLLDLVLGLSSSTKFNNFSPKSYKTRPGNVSKDIPEMHPYRRWIGGVHWGRLS
jgi:hypothetical protein